MSDTKLDALVADVKKLNARVAALEKLLERILRQKPVSKKQLVQMLKSRGVTPPDARGYFALGKFGLISFDSHSTSVLAARPYFPALTLASHSSAVLHGSGAWTT
jgi:hypothetical protein